MGRTLLERVEACLALLSLAIMLIAGCGDDGPGPEPQEDPLAAAQWEVLVEDLPGVLLSIWTGDGVTYAVGADSGEGPLVLRHRDGEWTQLQTGASGHLWWVASDGAGRLWMVGEAGLVLRHDLDDGSFSQIDLGTDATLFGVFFADDEHGWIVGGWVDPFEPGGPDGDRGALFRFDGDSFVAESRVPDGLLAQEGLFKVWGSTADDVWLSGEEGTLLHFAEDRFEAIETGVSSRLLTVHGSADAGPIAVGGSNNAVLVEYDEGEVVDRSLELDEGFAPALNGVHVVDARRALVVGNRGFIAERDETGDWTLPDETLTDLYLHAVTVDAAGGAWAVGGNLLTHRFDNGLILYRGNSEPAKGL